MDEQGKRLAAISREAKMKKAEERARVKECVDNANLLYLPVAGAVTIIVAYGVYGCLYSSKKEEQQQQGNVVTQPEEKKNHFEKL